MGDAPLEDWTKKELMEECKALGLSDKGNKAVIIVRIKEAKANAVLAVTPVVEETPEAEEEVAVIEEETPAAEEAPEETIEPEAVVEDTKAAPILADLDSSSIAELMAKNEQGEMSQKDFFRVFLVSVKNNLTTNQRLADIEKRLDDTDSRLEKIEVVENAPSEAPTEPEPQAEEPTPQIAEETAEEDITALVEKAEKAKKRTSRKRSQKASGTQREGRPKRVRV